MSLQAFIKTQRNLSLCFLQPQQNISLGYILCFRILSLCLTNPPPPPTGGVSPSYSPTSPAMGADDASPAYSPSSPGDNSPDAGYSPSFRDETSPAAYSPSTPAYSPASPAYSPTTPRYSPASPRLHHIFQYLHVQFRVYNLVSVNYISKLKPKSFAFGS